MSDRRSNYLLVGAGGLVGQHLREALSGRNMVATYHRAPPEGGVALDITQSDSARKLIARTRPDVVLLAAADPFVERCEREPGTTRLVNVEATRVIAEATRSIGALLVVFSSEYVFDGTAGDYGESDERHPINEYGRQKVEVEDIALSSGRALVCRTSGVFGADPDRKNFVLQLVDRLRAGGHFDVPTDQLITPTYAPSLARAVIELADASHTGVFHVAGPRILARPDFAAMVVDAFSLPHDQIQGRATHELGLAAARPLRCGLRVEKLRATLKHDLTDPISALRQMAS